MAFEFDADRLDMLTVKGEKITMNDSLIKAVFDSEYFRVQK